MPGLLGITYLPGDPPALRADLFRRMCDRLRGPHDRLEVHETPDCALAVSRLDTDAGPDRLIVSPGQAIAFDATSRGDESPRYNKDTSPHPLHGDESPCHLTPPSALAIWNPRDRSLRLLSDRYGFSPLSYTVRQGRFLFASSALALLASPGDPPHLDPHAVSDLLSFGHLLEDRTLVEDIRLLPPASILTWRDGQVSLSRTWTPAYREDEGGPSGPDAVRQMADRLHEAVRRCSGDPIGVLLSGGLDSRTLVAIASRLHRITALTFGEPGTDDLEIARRVAHLLEVEHHTFEISPDDLPRYAGSIVRRTDGALNLHHACAAGAFPAIRERCAAVLSGMHLLGSFVPSRLKAGESVLPFLIPPLPRETRRALLTDGCFEQTERHIPESLAAVEAACPFRSPVNRLDALDIAQRQRRFILAGLLPLRDRVEVRLPLFDEDLMGFVRGVAPSLRADQRLYIDAFCHLFPDLARIPWAKTGLPVSASPPRRRLARLWRRLRGHRPRPSLAFTGTWHARSPALRAFERDLLLGQTARQRGIFRPDAVERLLSEQEQGLHDHWDLIGRMVTLELWCQVMATE
ncbi:MAG: asparagine synthetase B family protein [Candidatus Latescibacteria bacterium]|nr:asparagine synthetase B family protein [Candidatus Latescibacterota bacterium]